MNEYIIGIIYAIDILCNITLIFLWINLYDKFKWNIPIKKSLRIIFIIALLGTIFIPSKETMEILINT